jgi:predicted RNA-binding protein YlqC (UPF0109 family)
MKDLVTQIARALVDKPEEVAVAEVQGNQTSVLELRVAKDDIGKVIGKQGRIAHAMRTIVSSVSAKEKKRTVLEIMDWSMPGRIDKPRPTSLYCLKAIMSYPQFMR